MRGIAGVVSGSMVQLGIKSEIRDTGTRLAPYNDEVARRHDRSGRISGFALGSAKLQEIVKRDLAT